MILIKAVKILVCGFIMMPLAFGALSTGVLFGLYNIAVSRNPDESESLYNTTLVGFAFIETFVFMAIFIAILIVVLL